MGKRRFELEPTPEEQAPEEGLKPISRRLEIKNPDGTDHKKFSVEAGTVVVDTSENEAYIHRKEEERRAIAVAVKKKAEEHNRKIDELVWVQVEREQISAEQVAKSANVFFLFFAVACAAGGLRELYFLAQGRPGAGYQALFFLFLCVASVFVAYQQRIPERWVRPLLRLGYAAVLITFGFGGIAIAWSNLTNPGPNGINWAGTLRGIASMVGFALAVRFLLPWLLKVTAPSSAKGEEHPWRAPWPRMIAQSFGTTLTIVFFMSLIGTRSPIGPSMIAVNLFLTILLIRYLVFCRRQLNMALEDPEHAVFRASPLFKDRRFLDLVTYTAEAAIMSLGYVVLMTITQGMTLAYFLMVGVNAPLLIFFMLYPAFFYVLMRALTGGIFGR